jgi:predicted transposase/invertase (TIGR01784 family)
MQVAPSLNIFERICFYQAKMLVEQVGRGEKYGIIKKVISIVVADFCLIDNGDPNRYHHCYRPHDSVDDTYFGDVEEIHVLELPKLPADSDKTPVWDWAKFIGVETEEDLDMIAAQSNVMKTAVNELYRVSADAEVRRQYDQREKAWRDEMARHDFAEKKGREEGIKIGEAKGLAKGRAEAAAQYEARIAELERQLAGKK